MGKDPQPLTEDSVEWKFPSGKELGALLRTRRQELGLSHAQIADQIKVRAVFLEALENEDWDRLPSSAFIKGFIRSYARVLGLSEEGLIALYQENAPLPQPIPRPLQAPPKKSRAPLYLILIFAVLAGGIAVYHWVGHPGLTGKPAEKEPALSTDERPDAAPAGRNEHSAKEEMPPHEAPQPPAPLDPERAQPRETPVKGPGLEETGRIEQPSEAPPQAVKEVPPLETEKSTEVETPVSETARASESDSPPLVLKASVRERTWVRVTIDDQKPKEYIFDPKSSPEWRAHKGFELLIGNAGGIDFEFNGRQMTGLGKQGQVVKLRFPPADERSDSTY